jgi:heavy metal translocating P-type ATPase
MSKLSKLRSFAVFGLVPGIVGFLILASWILASAAPFPVSAGLALLATAIGGWQRFLAGFQDLFHGRITVNVFVVVALSATLAIGEFRPAAIIIFIMVVVGALETFTMDKSRQSIRSLLDLTPRTATIRVGQQERIVPVEEIQVGTAFIVHPGERIPVDGVVSSGTSSVNQAPITGESMPVEKYEGCELFSGSLNLTGRMEARASKVGEDTMLARIVQLVEKAQTTKAPIQDIADRFTVWFLPTVLVLAVIVYLTSGDLKSAVSILLVACPCAFAIATPTAVTAGISNMARKGILVKGGMFLEIAAKLDALVVDKTGTFTMGQPSVLEVLSFSDASKLEVLQLAAAAEKYSEHPLAKAVLERAKAEGLEIPRPDEFKIEVGKGVLIRWKDEAIAVGQPDYLRSRGIALSSEMDGLISGQLEQGRTVIVVARGTKALGLISIADEVRPETRNVISTLYRVLGNTNITMLTGDNPRVAASVAEQIGIERVESGMLPEGKYDFIKRLQESGLVVGMIGDGINDAPALALADVGIAMGASGTDVAIEAADVALMNDNLERVADFILLSRTVIRRIKANIFLSLIYNVVGIILGAFGLLSPIIAIIFQEAGCISVVFSSTLLLWARPKRLPA